MQAHSFGEQAYPFFCAYYYTYGKNNYSIGKNIKILHLVVIKCDFCP